MTFNAAAVQAVFDTLVSDAQKLGVFERVRAHEPKSAPGAGLSLAIWWDSIDPYPAGSGLAAVSARVSFRARIYRSFLGKDEDVIDPSLLAATASLLAALSGSFTLGGQARNVDLLGEAGNPLAARSAYVTQDDKIYRVADIEIPVIINDVWTESP